MMPTIPHLLSTFGPTVDGPYTEPEIHSVELKLGFRFEEEYRQSLIQTGTVDFLRVAKCVEDSEVALPAAHFQVRLADVPEITEHFRSAGLPGDLVVFATTLRGDPLCFEPGNGERVVRFDHDMLAVEHVADSFGQLIRSYASILKG